MNADPVNQPLTSPTWRQLVGTAPVVRLFDDGALLVVPETGTLLLLNRSGASIYDGILQGRSAGEISIALSRRFGITIEQAERDVQLFL